MPRAAQRILTSWALLLLLGCASSPSRSANPPPVIHAPQPVIYDGLTYTGRPLDVAIHGPGFFIVALPDGQTGYTRVGKFFFDDSERLIVRSGRDYPISPLLRIRPGGTNITIYMEGAITCNFPGQTASQYLGQIKLAVFSNPAGLKPINADPVFIATENSGQPMLTNPGGAGSGQIMQNYLESPHQGQ